MSFIAGDGVTPIEAGNGQTGSGFYYEIDCSVNGSGYVVIPVFTIQTTTDGNLPLSLFTGQLFDDGAPREIIFGFQNSAQGWSIPATLAPNCALSDLWEYNQASVLFYPPLTYWTADQVIEYVSAHGGSGFSGPSGYSGFSGRSGYSGFSGPSGYSGFSSASGYSGFSGPSGYSGFSAISGYSGFTGVSGYSGYSGFSAVSGYSGYSGSGVSGYSGYSGMDGSAVASGYSGYTGISGYSGFSGANPGASGYSGFSGRSGYSGYSGSGVSGYSGSGVSGYSGFSGRSGYSGFSGSGVSGYSGFSAISGYSGFSGGGGSGDVTVVGGGSLTSTAVMTGGGAEECQTPSAISTLSAGGNMVLAGTLTTGSGGGVGVIQPSAGTFASLPASPSQGAIAAITNSNTNTWGATIAGGGAFKVMGYFNGTVWTVFAV